MHIESVEHLIWECQITQAFWNKIQSFFISKGYEIKLNLRDICFGLKGANNILNFIIILCKYFIFKMKYSKNIVKIFQLFFLPLLNYRIRTEKEISLMHDKIHKYEEKWSSFTIM